MEMLIIVLAMFMLTGIVSKALLDGMINVFVSTFRYLKGFHNSLEEGA